MHPLLLLQGTANPTLFFVSRHTYSRVIREYTTLSTYHLYQVHSCVAVDLVILLLIFQCKMNKRKQAPTELVSELRSYKKPKKQIILSKHSKRKYLDIIGANPWKLVISFLNVVDHLKGVCLVSKRMYKYAVDPVSWPAKIAIPNCCWFPLTNESKTMFSRFTSELCLTSKASKHAHLIQPLNTPFYVWGGNEVTLAEVASLCSNLKTLQIRDLGVCSESKGDLTPPYLARDILHCMRTKHLQQLRVELLCDSTGLTTNLLNLEQKDACKVDHLSVTATNERPFNTYRYIASARDCEAKQVELTRLLFMSQALPQTAETLRLSNSMFMGIFHGRYLLNASCQLRRFEMDDTLIHHFVKAYSCVLYYCPQLEEIVGTRLSWDVYSATAVQGMNDLPASKTLKKLTIESRVTLRGSQMNVADPGGISFDAVVMLDSLSKVCRERELASWKLELTGNTGERHAWIKA